MKTNKVLHNPPTQDEVVAALVRILELGLIEQVEPGKYKITELGKQALTDGKEQ